MLLGPTVYSLETFVFGTILGLLFVTAFFSFAKAVANSGTALATISSRLSVIIPIVFSIIIFNEEPSTLKLIGFAFTAVALVFFYFSLSEKNNPINHKGKFYLLLFVLIAIGMCDFSLKIYKSVRPQDEEKFFVFVTFFFAFIYSLLYIIFKKVKIDKRTFITGLGLGIPNVFSTIFLLAALSHIPAIVVYPTINIGIIILTAIGAYIFWREKLNKAGLAAMIAGLIAITFLSIK
jgi:drug/metabolite transporter (DMT)-like permease